MPVMPEQSCPHPYFSVAEMLWFFAAPVLLVWAIVTGLLIVLGGAIWLRKRGRAGATTLASGVLMLVAYFVGLAPLDAGVAFRSQFGADDLAKLQRELQTREADLARYDRENPGLSNSQVVKGFLESHHRRGGFYFSDPMVPPVFFKASDWRDHVPRIVVSFGCGNNIVFDSMTMDIEQLD